MPSRAEEMIQAYAGLDEDERAQFRAMLTGYDLAQSPAPKPAQQRSRKKSEAMAAAAEPGV